MKKTSFQPSTGQSFDRNLANALKITAIGAALTGILSATGTLSPVWIAIVLILGLLVSASLMLTKAAITGKRYAEGARHRRNRTLPFAFQDNDGLEEELV